MCVLCAISQSHFQTTDDLHLHDWYGGSIYLRALKIIDAGSYQLILCGSPSVKKSK